MPVAQHIFYCVSPCLYFSLYNIHVLLITYLCWLDCYVLFVTSKTQSVRSRGGSRGRVQGVRTPPWDEAFFIFAFKICLPHRSVTSFLRGAPPPKKNPGSAPAIPPKTWMSPRKLLTGTECPPKVAWYPRSDPLRPQYERQSKPWSIPPKRHDNSLLSSQLTKLRTLLKFLWPLLFSLDKGGKFLKKLWCCVGGSITR